MIKTKCSKFKTTQEHRENLDEEDFTRDADFRHENYEVEWTCKECKLTITEYYPYSGYMIRDKDGNELDEVWN